jgi:TetR/AcrR family transcriptional regulator
MVKVKKNTEDRILAAAKKVFHTRGFDGARMQEIADEAGINKALLHYYYRNKENLFRAVFQDAFTQLLSGINEIFLSDRPFLSKIEILLDYYISFLSKNSYLPLFILNTLANKPEEIKIFLDKQDFSPLQLMDTIRNQMKKELHLDVDPFHIYINLLSVTVFPVVARPLIQTIFGFTAEQMDVFLEERKKVVPVFISNALKGYESQKKQGK